MKMTVFFDDVRVHFACVDVANDRVTMRSLCERHRVISVSTSINSIINPSLCIIAIERCVTTRRHGKTRRILILLLNI